MTRRTWRGSILMAGALPSTVAVLLIATANAATAVGDVDRERIDAVFAEWDSTASPGCSVAAAQDGALLYSRGYGMASLEYGAPNRAATRFHVASVSKQFTAAAIVLLAMDGRISLDDPVRKYVPELADFGVPITIRNLAHHSSGLRDHWSILDLSGWRYSQDRITDDDILSVLVRQKRLEFQPGTEHRYSNTNYFLLAQIVERVSGMSLREFTAQRIFEPLGMHDTFFRDDFTEVERNFAYGYGREKGAFRTSVTNFDTVGATSLITTAEDLMLWADNFRSARVGGQAFVRQMLEPETLKDGSRNSYAFGIKHGSYRGLPTILHSGADAGYLSHLIIFPEQGFSVAVLCNINQARTFKLATQVAAIFIGQHMTPEQEQPRAAKAVRLSQQQLHDRAGLYFDAQSDRAFEVQLHDGVLAVSEDDSSTPLVARDSRNFVLEDSSRRIEFPAGKGPAPRLICHDDEKSEPTVYSRVSLPPLDAAALGEYVGIYESDEIDAPFRVVLRGDELWLTSIKLRQSLRPVTRDVFTSPWSTIRFQRDNGRVTGFAYGVDRDARYRFVRR